MTVDKMVVTNYFVTEELCHMINSDLLCEIYWNGYFQYVYFLVLNLFTVTLSAVNRDRGLYISKNWCTNVYSQLSWNWRVLPYN